MWLIIWKWIDLPGVHDRQCSGTFKQAMEQFEETIGTDPFVRGLAYHDSDDFYSALEWAELRRLHTGEVLFRRAGHNFTE